MLNRHFDAHRPHTYVRYARMSSEMQNPRSPEQQYESIDLALRRSGHSWSHAGDYRDDAISGRYVGKRPGFMRMLDDLKSGRVKADLILVDTFERFGRADEVTAIRQGLQARQRILVLTADTYFSDPTSPAGRALSVIEGLRSTEDGRVKAHNVLRGKRDTAARGRWPGAPVPLGYRLRVVMVERNGVAEPDGHVLEPDPATRMLPTRIFALAVERGWGSRRIARELNGDPRTPRAVRPFSDERVRLCLANTLYMGVLTYGRHCTGIVDDRQVRERVEPGEELVVEKFCEPLVSREVFEAAGELRRGRREARSRKSRVSVGTGPDGRDDIMPESRKLLLTGLVRCGDCGGAMDVSSHTITKNGVTHAYRYYKCRNQTGGRCGHRSGVREDVLREVVVAKLRWRLFPPPGRPGEVPAWLPRLAEEVRAQVEARSRGEGDPRPALVEELRQLEGPIKGWSISLGNAELASSSRSALEGLLAGALARRDEVGRLLAELEATRVGLDAALDEEAVMGRLRRLEEMLAAGNVAEGNRELRRVIERVACHSDGRVELRTHRQGLFEGVTSWLSPSGSASGESRPGAGENDGSKYWTDPVELAKPRRAAYPSWARANAAEVQAKRRETGWNVKRLAEHFGKCRETIDRALAWAGSSSPSAGG